MIFQQRIEVAIFNHGKTIENSSGKFSKITYNIHYLFAHKHSYEDKWLHHYRPKIKNFQMVWHYFSGLEYTKQFPQISKLSSPNVGFLSRK